MHACFYCNEFLKSCLTREKLYDDIFFGCSCLHDHKYEMISAAYGHAHRGSKEMQESVTVDSDQNRLCGISGVV